MKNVTAFILAGGSSTRLKQNKALLELGGKTVIEIIYYRLQNLFDQVIISTAKPDLFNFLPCPKIMDNYQNIGPLGGVQACLTFTKTEYNFIISTDLPLVSKPFIEELLNIDFVENVLIPEADNYKQYLCAIYKTNCLTTIDNIISKADLDGEAKNRHFSLYRAVELCGFRRISPLKMKGYFPDMFCNINTREDYEKIKELVSNNPEILL